MLCGTTIAMTGLCLIYWSAEKLIEAHAMGAHYFGAYGRLLWIGILFVAGGGGTWVEFDSDTRQRKPWELRREVKFDGEGFEIFEGDESKARLRWSDVREVFAYKMDLVTHDEICIGFRVNADGSHWWVSEEFIGYRELVEELKRRFPGISDDWFWKVASPAFVLNRATLWGESWPSPQP
jgi:hypothetical protein